MDNQQQAQYGTVNSNSVTFLEAIVIDTSWKPVTDFPPNMDGKEDDPTDYGHEIRSNVLWLYQPAHESKNSDGEATVWPGHVYLGMCIRPLIKTTDGYDYGDPYFIDLGHRSICAVTMWRRIDTPTFPYDPLEAKGRADGTIFNPECHKGNKVRDEGTPSNFV
jgi:hypothetical protein